MASSRCLKDSYLSSEAYFICSFTSSSDVKDYREFQEYVE